MTPDVILLTVLTVLTSILTIAVLAATVVCFRLAGSFNQLRARVDSTLQDVERDMAPTMREIRGVARSLSDLSISGKRLTEEMVLGYAARRSVYRGSRGGHAQVLHSGLDLAIRALDLWRHLKTNLDEDGGREET